MLIVNRPYTTHDLDLAVYVTSGMKRNLEQAGVAIGVEMRPPLRETSESIILNDIVGEIDRYTIIVTNVPFYYFNGLDRIFRKPSFGHTDTPTKKSVVSTWGYREMYEGGIVYTAMHELGEILGLGHHEGECAMRPIELPTKEQMSEIIRQGKALRAMMDVMVTQVKDRKPYFCEECVGKLKAAKIQNLG